MAGSTGNPGAVPLSPGRAQTSARDGARCAVAAKGLTGSRRCQTAPQHPAPTVAVTLAVAVMIIALATGMSAARTSPGSPGHHDVIRSQKLFTPSMKVLERGE